MIHQQYQFQISRDVRKQFILLPATPVVTKAKNPNHHHRYISVNRWELSWNSHVVSLTRSPHLPYQKPATIQRIALIHKDLLPFIVEWNTYRHIDSDLLKWNWTMRRPLSVREWILLSPLICLYASIALWFFCQIPRKPDCISSIPNGLRTLAVITGTQLTCSSCLSLNKQTQHHFQAVYSAAYDSSNDNIIPYIETAKCGHTNHIQIELLDAHHCCRVE